MTEPEDIFQQRLEKLEAGEPLEACQRGLPLTCLLYTSDAADERSSVDLGGRRIINKKKKEEKKNKKKNKQKPMKMRTW